MDKLPLSIPPLLEPHRDAILAMLEPSLDLDEEPLGVGGRADGSQLFGSPLLEHVGDWPRTPEGRPMFFVGQLNLGELVPSAPGFAEHLPATGLLSFFYDLDQPPAGADPEDRYRFRLLWSPQVTGRSIPLPAGAPALPGAERALRGRPAWRLPSEVDRSFQLGSLDEASFDAYNDLLSGLAVSGAHHLLGPADWLEGDPRQDCERATASLWGGAWRSPETTAGAREWRLLWQIGDNDDLEQAWGDAVRLYVMIREEDLAARRFLRAWVVRQG